MSRKKTVAIIVAVFVVLALGIGVTLAYLAAASRPVNNTFTVGNVEIELTETTGGTYLLSPGTTLKKDPVLTVKAKSDEAWLFFLLEKDATLDYFVTYAFGEGWSLLEGYENVYYRAVPDSDGDQSFSLLKNSSISVKETVTEEELKSLKKNPKMTFTGYAIQKEGVASAEEAWEILKQKEVSDR